jgi:hypothetical protein
MEEVQKTAKPVSEDDWEMKACLIENGPDCEACQ